MPKPMPSWAARDLETSITLKMNALAALTAAENDPNIPNHIRELISDARTNVKMSLMLDREIRNAHELLLEGNGKTQARQR